MNAALPAVHRILAEPSIRAYDEALGHAEVKRAVERTLDLARLSDEAPPYEALVGSIAARLEDVRMRELVPVINATGILLHTNLGRAPLAADALAAIGEIGVGYTNLEFDLTAGERSSRYERLTGSVRALTGAADALIINNCAAAVLLILDTFARGREVVVARSQLIEIGGGFRLPDVLVRSGATLVEVGTTNRVYLHDYQRALSPRTALLLRTHPSNYAIEGFTHDPTARESSSSDAVQALRSLKTSATGRSSILPSTDCRTSERFRRLSAMASGLSRSPATSCSVGRRPVWSSGGRSSSRGCATIRCCARCASTSSRWRRSVRRSRSTGIARCASVFQFTACFRQRPTH